MLERFCSSSGCWECAFTCLALGIVGGTVFLKDISTHTTFKKNTSILLPAITGALVTSFESALWAFFAQRIIIFSRPWDTQENP